MTKVGIDSIDLRDTLERITKLIENQEISIDNVNNVKIYEHHNLLLDQNNILSNLFTKLPGVS